MLERLKSVLPAYAQAYSVRWSLASNTNPNGKREGKYKTFRQPPPDAVFFEHFEGVNGLNMQPLLDHEDFPGSVCQWGAIDVDAYGQDGLAEKLEKRLRSWGFTPYCEPSKSGGAHIYFVLKSPVKAKSLRDNMVKIATWLGLPRKSTEYRPAQNEVDFAAGDLGHFMILPGYGRPLADVVEALEECAMEAKTFNKLIDEGEMADGPPCLFPLLLEGRQNNWTNRNKFVYQLSVFFKYKYPADFKERVKAFLEKEMTNDPLPEKEVDGILGNVEKNSKTHFMCTDAHFERVCNKTLCQSRKFGVAAREDVHSMFAIDAITQLETDPPTWFLTLTVKGGESKRMKLTTQQLFNVRDFKKRCMEELRSIPTPPKQEQWEEFLTQQLKSAHVIPVPFEMTEAARVLDVIYRFVLSSPKSTEQEHILRGRVLTIPKETGITAFFRMTDLANYMERAKVRGISSADLFTVLNELQGMKKASQKVLSIPPIELDVWSVEIDSKYMKLQTEIDLA